MAGDATDRQMSPRPTPPAGPQTGKLDRFGTIVIASAVGVSLVVALLMLLEPTGSPLVEKFLGTALSFCGHSAVGLIIWRRLRRTCPSWFVRTGLVLATVLALTVSLCLWARGSGWGSPATDAVITSLVVGWYYAQASLGARLLTLGIRPVVSGLTMGLCAAATVIAVVEIWHESWLRALRVPAQTHVAVGVLSVTSAYVCAMYIAARSDGVALFRRVTVLFAWGTGAFFAVAVILQASDVSVFARFGAPMLLAVTGLTLGLLWSASRVRHPRTLEGTRLIVEVRCPSCADMSDIPVGGSPCPTCGTVIRVSASPPRCARCGYALGGLERAVCPECGLDHEG